MFRGLLQAALGEKVTQQDIVFIIELKFLFCLVFDIACTMKNTGITAWKRIICNYFEA